MKRLKLGFLSVALLALVFSLVAVDAYAATVTRTFNPDPVAPGGTVTVTVTVTFAEAVQGLVVRETPFGTFTNLTHVSETLNGGAVPNGSAPSGGAEPGNPGSFIWFYLFQQFQAGDVLVIKYTLDVPANEPEGDKAFAGDLDAAVPNGFDAQTTEPNGPLTVQGGGAACTQSCPGALLTRALPTDGTVGEVVNVNLGLTVQGNTPASVVGGAVQPNLEKVSGVAVVEDLPAGAQFVKWVQKPFQCKEMDPATAQAAGGDIGLFCGTQDFNKSTFSTTFKYQVQLPTNPGQATWNGTVSGQLFASPATPFNNVTRGDTQVNVTGGNLCQQYDATGTSIFKNNNKLDLGSTFPAPGTELNRAISDFLNNAPSPGGTILTLTQIQTLIAFFKEATPCDQFQALTFSSSATVEPVGFLGVLASLFQAEPVSLKLDAASLSVQPGETFTVTVAARAGQDLAGLALAAALPAGWSARLSADGQAGIKADDALALWLDTARGTSRTVSYQITVPAEAQPGSYAVGVEASAGLPRFVHQRSLQVSVTGAQTLNFQGLSLQTTSTGTTFVAQGSGVGSLQVRIYSLSGGLVFDETVSGRSLRFAGLSSNGQSLANGVYLAVVTVRGVDGQSVRAQVQKIALLR